MQDETDMYVTRDKLNNASMRHKPDPLYKNILWRQIPYELVFKDVSSFDEQNPITSKLLLEIEIEKNNSVDKKMKKAPSTKEVEIRSQLNSLRRFNNRLPGRKLPDDDDNDDDDNDDGFNFNFYINSINNNNNDNDNNNNNNNNNNNGNNNIWIFFAKFTWCSKFGTIRTNNQKHRHRVLDSLVHKSNQTIELSSELNKFWMV